MGLHQGVGCRVHAREEIADFLSGVVVDIAKGLDLGEPLHVAGVVREPNCSVEGHLVILGQEQNTI